MAVKRDSLGRWMSKERIRDQERYELSTYYARQIRRDEQRRHMEEKIQMLMNFLPLIQPRENNRGYLKIHVPTDGDAIIEAVLSEMGFSFPPNIRNGVRHLSFTVGHVRHPENYRMPIPLNPEHLKIMVRASVEERCYTPEETETILGVRMENVSVASAKYCGLAGAV